MKVFCQLFCSVVLLLLPRSSVFDQHHHHHHHHSMQRSAAIRIWGRATMAYGFPSNVVSVRLQQQQQQQRLLEHSMRWMNRGNNVGRQLFTAAMCPQYRIPQTRVSGTNLYFYNQRHQRQNREMSKITEARNIERMKKKRQQQKDGTDKNKKKEPYEWLPFWTTPERDPYDSIYIQDPIEEEDCDLLRLYIPTEDDMLEIGTMCAMLFFTTPNLETYESMPNNGDVIFLKGDLGTGKSVFARGFVRGALGDWEIDVPSPTYLLSNTYFASETKGSNKNIEIHHMDLYRLQEHANQQYFMLNLDHVFKNCVSLIEWPERLPEALVPEERLELSIEYATLAKRDGTIDMESTKQFRILTFTPYGHTWRRRVYDIRYMGYIEDLKMKNKDEFNPNNPQN